MILSKSFRLTIRLSKKWVKRIIEYRKSIIPAYNLNLSATYPQLVYNNYYKLIVEMTFDI